MKNLLAITLIVIFISACGNGLTADQISKMSEEQIAQVTPEQIGKMSPGELEVFHDRRSHFVSERTKAQKERARKIILD